MTVIQKARFLPSVNTSSVRCVQSEAGRTLATIGAVRVDAGTAALTNPAIELAFIDVGTVFAVYLRVTFGTLADRMFANFARAAPGYPDRAAALGTKSHFW